MKRRDFVKSSAAAVFSAAPLLNLACPTRPKKLDKVGLQLYSVRNLMGEDFAGTITKVAEAGYDSVEFAGYYEHSPEEIRALLDQLGLTSPANHTGYPMLMDDNLEQTINVAKIIGHEYLVLPSLPRERPPRERPRAEGGQPSEQRQRPVEGQRPQEPVFTLERVKEIAGIFNRIGATCRNAGLGFAYHNHRNEFQQIEGGGIMYDILLQETDPELVDFEIDLGWAVAAGADPLAYFDKYPGRFKLFHVKDMNEENQSVVIGQGMIDFASIFAQSEKAGVKYYIVEYEGREDPMASVAASVEYLKKLTF